MHMTLIVRLSRDGAGELSGVVERVKTGQKERFVGMEILRSLIERMARDGAAQRRPTRARRSDP